MSKTTEQSRPVVDDILGILDDRGRAKKNSKRSPQWRKIEETHLSQHPTCAFCGGKEGINVHHVLPFELFPDYELQPDNLITLCAKHHLDRGHLGRWDWFNPLVRSDAEQWAFRLRAAKPLMALAKKETVSQQ